MALSDRLPPAPPPAHGAIHGVRILGWLALIELITGAGLVAISGRLSGQAHWILLAAIFYAGTGALIGTVLGRSTWLSNDTFRLCGAIGLFPFVLGWFIDGHTDIGWKIGLAVCLSFLRWRFPGTPSRKRLVFRIGFAITLVIVLLILGARPPPSSDYRTGPAGTGPNVVVIVLDTVRRDHLSTYGYKRDTSPNLDALAARGSRFNGWANAPWSVPGHATILTGRYSASHGAHYEHTALTPDEITLQERFHDQGYDTLGITGNPWIREGSGLGDNFLTFIESWSVNWVPSSFIGFRALAHLGPASGDKGGSFGAHHFDRWLTHRPDPQRPFFAFINIMEAHAPYDRVHSQDTHRYTQSDLGRVAGKRLSNRILRHQIHGDTPLSPADSDNALDLYDGAIRGADRILGLYLETLASHHLTQETLILVTSDHGEFLGEHDLWGHVHGLYEPVLQVPFVLAGPGVPEGSEFTHSARLIDAAPTLLHLALGPHTDFSRMEGRDLLTSTEALPVVAEHYRPVVLMSESDLPAIAGDLEEVLVRRRSVFDQNHKLHLQQGPTTDTVTALYNLGTDPHEAQDLRSQQTEPLNRLQQIYDDWSGTTDAQWPTSDAPAVTLDDWEHEALRVLGYSD